MAEPFDAVEGQLENVLQGRRGKGDAAAVAADAAGGDEGRLGVELADLFAHAVKLDRGERGMTVIRSIYLGCGGIENDG